MDDLPLHLSVFNPCSSVAKTLPEIGVTVLLVL